MSDPILRRFSTEKGKGPNQNLPAIMADLGIAGIRAVYEDLLRQMRYGRITDAPVSVDFNDVSLADDPQLFRVISITAVLPVALGADGIADTVRAAVLKVQQC